MSSGVLTGRRSDLNHCVPGCGWSHYTQCCAVVAVLLLMCLRVLKMVGVTCWRSSLVESVLTGFGNGGRGPSPPGRSRVMQLARVKLWGNALSWGWGRLESPAEEGRRQCAGKWSPRTSASFAKPCQTHACCVT